MRYILITSALLIMSGCSSLLPKSSSETPKGWSSYEQAKTVFDHIQPQITTRRDLSDEGIDPYKMSGVTILSFADVLQRFNVGPLQMNDIDPGLVACLKVGKRCTGYAIVQQNIKKDRIGNFFVDSFHFKQETATSGWTFNGTILFVDDTVVYSLYGGQPVVQQMDVAKYPLGPLQGWANEIKPTTMIH